MDTSEAIKTMTLGDLEWFEDMTNMPFTALDEDSVNAKQMIALSAIVIANRDNIDRSAALSAARLMKLEDVSELL